VVSVRPRERLMVSTLCTRPFPQLVCPTTRPRCGPGRRGDDLAGAGGAAVDEDDQREGVELGALAGTGSGLLAPVPTLLADDELIGPQQLAADAMAASSTLRRRRGKSRMSCFMPCFFRVTTAFSNSVGTWFRRSP